MNRIDKTVLGLAGEYAVASELCRRGFFAQITYGRWKNTDIIAVNPAKGKTVLIEVKSKQGAEWPSINGIRGSNRFQVLVDYERVIQGHQKRPDFYILDESFWNKYVDRMIRECRKKDPNAKVTRKDNEKIILFKEKQRMREIRIKYEDDRIVFEWPSGNKKYFGVNLKPSDVKSRLEQWDLIIKALS